MKIKHYLAASALAVSAAFVLVSPGAQAANDCPATDPDPSDNTASIQIDGVGGVCAAGGAESGHIWADGDDTSPASGFVSIANDPASDNQGVCADDHGGPAADDEDGDPTTNPDPGESPTCAPALPAP